MTEKQNDVLKHHRQEIDRIDNAIIDLLAQRSEVVHAVGKIKSVHNIPACLPDRIQHVIDTRMKNAHSQGVDVDLVRTIWTEIINTAIAQEQALMHAKDSDTS